jgi:hypothetical protein
VNDIEMWAALVEMGQRSALLEKRLVPYHDDETGQDLNVHNPDVCANDSTPCVFHSPTEHKMRSWPMNIRETGLIERMCPHGIGHPDPDSAAYFGDGWDIHGCDGCCFREEEDVD